MIIFISKASSHKSENTVEYTVKEAAQPSLIINEFVSTLNDPETPCFSLTPNKDNIVLFKLSVS